MLISDGYHDATFSNAYCRKASSSLRRSIHILDSRSELYVHNMQDLIISLFGGKAQNFRFSWLTHNKEPLLYSLENVVPHNSNYSGI